MEYHITATFENQSVEQIENQLAQQLSKQGFGMVTEMDVQATLKQRLDVDMPHYKILGACNPNFAQRAIALEPKIGVLLPCNILMAENDKGAIEVSAISPVASMAAIDNPELQQLAGEVEARLKEALNNIRS